jgi:lantibiotic biosynthesis protein
LIPNQNHQTIKPELIKEIEEIVFLYANRTSENPDDVKKLIIDLNEKHLPLNCYFGIWDDRNLSQGFLSQALFFGVLNQAYPNQNWDYAAHKYLEKTVATLNKQHYGQPSFYGGIFGLGFVAAFLSENGRRYQNLLGQIFAPVNKYLEKHLKNLETNIKNNRVRYSDYDVINGISGILRSLIFANRLDVKESIYGCLHYLVLLAKHNSRNIPNWFIPPENQFPITEREAIGNLGLSHGISGVLSILSIASIKGYEIEGQKEAIRSISNNLIHLNYKFTWPSFIDLDIYQNKKFINKKTNNAGWCYGITGISRALWLSGVALNDNQLKDFSIVSLKRMIDQWDSLSIPTSTLCHGYAGILQVINRMYLDSEDDTLREFSSYLAREIIDKFFHDSEPFLFVNKEIVENKIYQFHHISFLNGASGICLSLLGIVSNPTLSWDEALLIS